MINIRKYYLVHIGPIRFTLVHSAHFGSIRFTLSYSVLVLFSRHWSYSVLFVPTQFTLIHFVLFSSLWSYSVLIVPISSYFVHSVHFVQFGPFVFTLVHFNLLRFFIHFHIGRRHVQVESTDSKFKYIYIYIKLVISKILSITVIIAILLLSYINIAFQSISVWLNLSESLSKH